MIIPRHILSLAAWVIVVAANAVPAAEDFAKQRFEIPATVVSTPMKTGNVIRYRLHTPESLDAKVAYPLIIFLHGAGERGTNNQDQLKNGVQHILAYTRAKAAPAFIVAPQSTEKWVDTPWENDAHTMPAEPSGTMKGLLALIESLKTNPAIDPDRIYVTGISMGGFGTWDIIQRRPDLSAAAMPICGGGDTAQAAQLKNLPIWAFHGDKDNVVKVIRSRDMIAAIEQAGGTPKYTEYRGGSHWVWDNAYKDHEAIAWLFAQKRAVKHAAGGRK